jgi:uncharacterized protein, YhcH/YjgK/YiaL family
MEQIFRFLEIPFQTMDTKMFPLTTEQFRISLEMSAPLRGDDCLYEYHTRHIDIHFCLRGVEKIQYAAKCSATESTDEEHDFFLADGDYSGECVLKPGMFAVFFENELHKPVLGSAGQTVSKAVVKITVQ